MNGHAAWITLMYLTNEQSFDIIIDYPILVSIFFVICHHSLQQNETFICFLISILIIQCTKCGMKRMYP